MGANCIFCSIVRGEAPATKVYEDELTLAFADIFPLERGHLLVVPKAHVENVYELDADLGAHLFRVTVRLAGVLKRELHPDGLNLFQANEVAGGQEVFHFHMHIMPRWKERMPFRIIANRTRTPDDELEKVFAPVRERMKTGSAGR